VSLSYRRTTRLGCIIYDRKDDRARSTETAGHVKISVVDLDRIECMRRGLLQLMFP